MTTKEDEELAEKYALNIEWCGLEYGKRKLHYRCAFLAGMKAAREQLANMTGFQDELDRMANLIERKDREISTLKQQLISAEAIGRSKQL